MKLGEYGVEESLLRAGVASGGPLGALGAEVATF
jgi:hypothetical protein